MEGLKQLFGSKKFVVASSTIISMLVAVYAGFDLSPEIIAAIVTAISTAFLISQGSADKGKHAAAIMAPVEMARIRAGMLAEGLDPETGKPMADEEEKPANPQ